MTEQPSSELGEYVITDDGQAIPRRDFERRWMILAVLCLSLLIVIIGNTALNVAIPRLSEDLHASLSQLQWIIDAYSLVFAGFLFTAGTLGDRYGRKRALQFGLALFLVGAVLAAAANTAGMVMGARAVMGFAAAFIMPSTLSILTNVFPANERPKAIATWAGFSGAGAAIGPIASGFIIEHWGWNWVFLVNVPVIALAFVVGAFIVPNSRDPHQEPIDVVGAALSIVALSSLVYVIIEGPHKGWTSAALALPWVLAIGGLFGFIAWELRVKHPMLDLRLFRDRRFSVASGGMSLTFFAMFGTFFLVAQYLQIVLGYSPLVSGLFQLPMAFIMMAIAPNVPKLVNRFGPATVVTAGLSLIAIGLAAFSFVGVETNIWWVYVAIVPLAAGMATTMTPLTTLIMASVPLDRAGVGSAMNDTTRELGGALGVAILGSVVTTQYGKHIAHAAASLPTKAQAYVSSGLTGALEVAKRLPDKAGAELADAAKRAFMDGMGSAALFGAGVVVIAAIIANRMLPRTAAAMTQRVEELPDGADGPSGDEPLLAGAAAE